MGQGRNRILGGPEGLGFILGKTHTHWSCGQYVVLTDVVPNSSDLSPHAAVLTLFPAAEVHKVTSGLGEEELINLIPHFLEEVPDPVCV